MTQTILTLHGSSISFSIWTEFWLSPFMSFIEYAVFLVMFKIPQYYYMLKICSSFLNNDNSPVIQLSIAGANVKSRTPVSSSKPQFLDLALQSLTYVNFSLNLNRTQCISMRLLSTYYVQDTVVRIVRNTKL